VTVRSRVCGNAGEIRNPATIRVNVTRRRKSFAVVGTSFISTSSGETSSYRDISGDAGEYFHLGERAWIWAE
jgi:hypothetical protein